MKLKKLKSVGHNTAASYLSTLSHIGNKYTSTVIYRIGLDLGVSSIKIDILNKTILPNIDNPDLIISLNNLKEQFIAILEKEEIPYKAVTLFNIYIDIIGNRKDVIDIRCRPVIIDWNNKKYDCALVYEKYPEPI